MSDGYQGPSSEDENDYGVAVADPDAQAERETYTLSADDILEADDKVLQFVATPEWAPKGHPRPDKFGVWVKALTGHERSIWQQRSVTINQKTGASTPNMRQVLGKIVQLSACNEQGKRLFEDSQIESLLRKNSAPLERISDLCMELSGIGADEKATIMGNSEADLSDSGSSD